MTKKFFKRIIDNLGLSDNFDYVIAEKIDRFQYDENTKQTILLSADDVLAIYKNDSEQIKKTNQRENEWERAH